MSTLAEDKDGHLLVSSSLVPSPFPVAILTKARKMVWELSAYSLAESVDTNQIADR